MRVGDGGEPQSGRLIGTIFSSMQCTEQLNIILFMTKLIRQSCSGTDGFHLRSVVVPTLEQVHPWLFHCCSSCLDRMADYNCVIA